MHWIHPGNVAHYNVGELESIEEVKAIFADGPDEMNWLFLSTSGVHGSYTTLNDLEETWDEDGEDAYHSITVLVCHPRMVCSKYGELRIEREDIPWLREMVTKTIEAIKLRQEGNLLTSPPKSIKQQP